jgi:hypothetical protein
MGLCHGRSLALLLVLGCAGACAGTEQAIFTHVSPEPGAASSAPEGGRPAPHDVPERDGGLTAQPTLDPGVTFEWTETLPGQGTCNTGVYTGVFSCDLKNGNPLTNFLSGQGTVSLRLGLSTERSQLPVEGELGGPLFGGSVLGSLDCSTDTLRAQVADGGAIEVDGLMGLMGATDPFVSFSTFTATLEGVLDRAALVIAGDFIMTSNDGQKCTGRFSTNVSP